MKLKSFLIACALLAPFTAHAGAFDEERAFAIVRYYSILSSKMNCGLNVSEAQINRYRDVHGISDYADRALTAHIRAQTDQAYDRGDISPYLADVWNTASNDVVRSIGDFKDHDKACSVIRDGLTAAHIIKPQGEKL